MDVFVLVYMLHNTMYTCINVASTQKYQKAQSELRILRKDLSSLAIINYNIRHIINLIFLMITFNLYLMRAKRCRGCSMR